MLSVKLRAALDNLLPDAGEDEAYLGTPTLRDAAVLIAFTDRPDPGVILTQRPQWLRSHAGQVAFPGGKIDPDDRDAIDAALREAEEEIGLSPRDVTVAGVSEPYRSGSGYIITPVLGVIPYLNGGLFEKIGRGKVGKPLTEIEGLMLGCQVGHLGKDGCAHVTDAVSLIAHVHLWWIEWVRTILA